VISFTHVSLFINSAIVQATSGAVNVVTSRLLRLISNSSAGSDHSLQKQEMSPWVGLHTNSICWYYMIIFQYKKRYRKVWSLRLISFAQFYEGTWGSGGIAPPFLTSPLVGGELSASRPCCFAPCTGWTPESVWRCGEEQALSLPGIESGSSSQQAIAIPTALNIKEIVSSTWSSAGSSATRSTRVDSSEMLGGRQTQAKGTVCCYEQQQIHLFVPAV
jgi:hypothetical protein